MVLCLRAVLGLADAWSSSRPPTSKNATRLGPLLLGALDMSSGTRPPSADLADPRAGKLQFGMAKASIGATGPAGSCSLAPASLLRCLCKPNPTSLTKSSSLPHARSATVGLLDLFPLSVTCTDSAATEPYLNRRFFTPRSRTNEPSTRAFATPVAMSNSIDARSERSRWSPCAWTTLGMR